MTSTLGRSSTPTDRAYLSIREVLELLIGDFPDVTISKIRFLEACGLIHPERTPSGYRKFYREDVERLRWILRQQRENYLPLNVIKVRLDGGQTPADEAEAPSLFDDAPYEPPPTELHVKPQPAVASVAEKPVQVFRGHPAEGMSAPRHLGIHRETIVEEEPVVASAAVEEREAPAEPLATLRVAAPVVEHVEPVPAPIHAPVAVPASEPVPPTPVAEAPTPRPRRRARSMAKDGYSVAELAVAIGADPQFVAEIASYGLIAGREVAGEHCYDEEARHLAQVAYDFSNYGIEPRHLKSLYHAANREAELFSQVVIPLLRQRNPEAREKAQADLAALVSLGAAFKSSLIQAELRNLTGG